MLRLELRLPSHPTTSLALAQSPALAAVVHHYTQNFLTSFIMAASRSSRSWSPSSHASKASDLSGSYKSG